MGRYSIIFNIQQFASTFDKIGEGAFAAVYEVRTEWQTHFAIKSFEKASFLPDIKMKKAFYNEINVMQQLNSRNIVSFDYMFETEKAYYLKMEYF